MTTSIIPAAANAPMLKYFESQGFNELYIDKDSVANQLMGEEADRVLDLADYAQYLRCMRNATRARLLADTSFGGDNLTNWATTADELVRCGADTILISDYQSKTANYQPNLLSDKDFKVKIQTMKAELADTHTNAIVNLGGFSAYGLAGLTDRIKIAHGQGIAKVSISNVTAKDLSIIGAIMTPNQEIGLAIDNPKMTFGSAQQVNPAFVLDTYHPKKATQQWVQKAGPSVVLRLYMGN